MSGAIMNRTEMPTMEDAQRIAARVSRRDKMVLLPVRGGTGGHAMTATPSDRSWFSAHPGRAYRVRPVSHEDANFWTRPAAIDLYLWCIVRRADGALRYFTLPAYAALDDTDEELGRCSRSCAPERHRSRRRSPQRPVAISPRSKPACRRSSWPRYRSSPMPAGRGLPQEMRARGCEVLALGGRETLSYLAGRIVEAMPERAAIHAAILKVAWDGLVELRP